MGGGAVVVSMVVAGAVNPGAKNASWSESGASLFFDTTPTAGQTPLASGDVSITGNLIFGGTNGGIGIYQELSRKYPKCTGHWRRRSSSRLLG